MSPHPIEPGEGAPHIRPKVPETFLVDAPDLLLRDVAPRALTLHVLPPLQRSSHSRRFADVVCVVRERPWQRCRIGAITLRCSGTRYELAPRARAFGLPSSLGYRPSACLSPEPLDHDEIPRAGDPSHEQAAAIDLKPAPPFNRAPA